MLAKLRRFGARGLILALLATGLIGVASAPAHAGGCRVIGLLNSETDLLVSAEMGYQGSFYGMLRARARTVGPWEKFQLCYLGDTTVFTLKSMANGKYVACEEEYPGTYQYMLRARSAAVGSWEKFVFYDMGDTFGFTGSPSYWVTASNDLPPNSDEFGVLRAESGGQQPSAHWDLIVYV